MMKIEDKIIVMAYKEFDIYDSDGAYELMVPKRYSKFGYGRYVYLFKPSKNPKSKTKVVIREASLFTMCRRRIECEDGKRRVVTLVGNFIVAGNVFNQRGESLGPNNKGYYVRPIDFEFDHSAYDIRFAEEELAKCKK